MRELSQPPRGRLAILEFLSSGEFVPALSEGEGKKNIHHRFYFP